MRGIKSHEVKFGENRPHVGRDGLLSPKKNQQEVPDYIKEPTLKFVKEHFK